MGMKHEIHHGLELPLAKKVLDKAMADYQERFSEYNPYFNWTGEKTAEMGFSAKGVKLTGDMEIKGDKVVVDVQVPFIFRVFKGKAMDVIDKQVKAWVERAKNGELDD